MFAGFEDGSIKAVRRLSQPIPSPAYPQQIQQQSGGQQQQGNGQPVIGLLNSLDGQPAAASTFMQQPQQLLPPAVGTAWAPMQAGHAALDACIMQAGDSSTTSLPAQELQQQLLPQVAAPWLPGLPVVEQSSVAMGLAAAPSHQLQQNYPQHQRQHFQQQQPQQPQQPQQQPQHSSAAASSASDLVAAIAEEVAEYDLLRQQQLEEQQKAAAVAEAARRVSQVAELSAAPPLQVVEARADSIRNNQGRLPSPLSDLSPASDRRRTQQQQQRHQSMSAARALQVWGHLLTPFEQREIASFQEVWFVGRPGTAKIRGELLPAVCGHERATSACVRACMRACVCVCVQFAIQ